MFLSTQVQLYKFYANGYRKDGYDGCIVFGYPYLYRSKTKAMSVHIAVDLGNSTCVLAGFDAVGQRTIAHFATPDILAGKVTWEKMVRSVLNDRAAKEGEVIISSVHPKALEVLLTQLHRQNVHVVLLDSRTYSCLPIDVLNPEEIGADLVASALYAYELEKTHWLIVGMGTALTFTLLDATGAIRGVNIAPGAIMALDILASRTALLPMVTLEETTHRFGRHTREAIINGVIGGIIGSVQFHYHQARAELGTAPQMLLTGGYADFFSPRIDLPHRIEQYAVIGGLIHAYRYIRHHTCGAKRRRLERAK